MLQLKASLMLIQKEYNKEPDSFAALGYDTAKILVKAIEKANSTDGDAIKTCFSWYGNGQCYR